MFGECLFGEPLFERSWDESLLRSLAPLQGLSLDLIEVKQLCEKVGPFVDQWIERISKGKPEIIVFPAISANHQQVTASLLFAKRLKQELPSSFVVFSGSAVEGIMGVELARQFPFVDVVISGAADEVLPILVREKLDGISREFHQGVHRQESLTEERDDDRLINTPVVDLERLPSPDHSDYFEVFDSLGLERWLPRVATFSTSRGCWWAKKNQCMFCSLLGKQPEFRSVTSEKALERLELALHQSKTNCAQSSDFIFNPAQLNTLITKLTQAEYEVSVFTELRPTVSKNELSQMISAGLNAFQTGIETFSTPLLKKVKKGTEGIRQVQFLKWAEELGAHVDWNLLCGLPDARAEDYQTSLDVIQLLGHIKPTGSLIDFILQRYSPYYKGRDSHFSWVAPSPAYKEIFRTLNEEAITRLAYNFSYNHKQAHIAAHYKKRLEEAFTTWKESYLENFLVSSTYLAEGQEELLIIDTRPIAKNRSWVLRGFQRMLYLACDSVQHLTKLKALAAEKEKQVEAELKILVEANLMLREGSQYLSLAIPLKSYLLSNEKRLALKEKVEQARLWHSAYAAFS